jgi:hypothetical protein
MKVATSACRIYFPYMYECTHIYISAAIVSREVEERYNFPVSLAQLQQSLGSVHKDK